MIARSAARAVALASALAIVAASALVCAQDAGGASAEDAAPAATGDAGAAAPSAAGEDAGGASAEDAAPSTPTASPSGPAANPGEGGEGAAPSAGGGEGEGGEGGEGGNLALPPEEPATTLSPEQQSRLQAAPGELTDREASGSHRFLMPPYLEEWGRGHHTRVLFPLYFETNVGDDHRLVIPPYYRIRAPHETGDVVFPFVFHLHGDDNGSPWATDVIPPIWWRRTHGPGRAHSQFFGALPIFSYGETFGENGRLQREHLVIPGLLTYHQWWTTGQMTVVGPVVYYRLRNEINWAVVPFVFRHITPQRSWTLIPPLLTYHSYNYDDNSAFTLVGPFFADVGPNVDSYNLAPLFFYRRDHDHWRLTVLPLFHTESGPRRFVLFTALGGYSRDGDESTVITPLYQNHRGLTSIDAVAPFFFYSRTPRLGKRTVALLPFGFYSTSNTGYAWGLFPFAVHYHEYGRSDVVATPVYVHSQNFVSRSSVTWIAPSIHIENHPDSHVLNVYPFVFTAGGRRWHHTVVFPFYWDITDEDSGNQVNVVFPFYVRIATRTQINQWTFPDHFYWERRNDDGQRSFGWDLAPFVQYGEPRRGDVTWSVLYGLAGYRRSGSYEEGQIFWIPFTLHGGQSSSPQPQQHARGSVQPNGDVLLNL